ncbi:MAG: redoxin domain-containing protein [Alphaproteobacteria bacterium]|nr:redoxin domain-containing protein [Alphaproteobacteria bacterium]
MPFDGDGDGLMDDVEANYGTLPDNPDSDDDGWLDGEEIDGFTDPTDPADHPYTGGWGIGACRNDVAGETVAVGSVAPNFEGVDQFGDTVRLHDFCHNAVLIVTGSEWCGPCQSYRSTMASYWADYHERGFMIIDLLLETADGSAIDQEALVRWADGHEYAVLDDTNGPISHQGYVNGGIPAISLIAPGGEIVILDGSPSASDIEAILPW